MACWALFLGIGRVGLELEMARGGWLLAGWVWLRKSSRLRSLWNSCLVIDSEMFDWFVQVFEQCWTCCSKKHVCFTLCWQFFQMFYRRCSVFSQKQREIDQGQSVHRRFFFRCLRNKNKAREPPCSRKTSRNCKNQLPHGSRRRAAWKTHVVVLETELTHAREDRANRSPADRAGQGRYEARDE